MKKVATFSGKEVLVIALACSVIFSVITWLVFTHIDKKQELSSNANDILDTYNDIVKHYYEEVDETELKNAAVSGMMDLLDEKYSLFLDEKYTSNFNNKLDGSYTGIGVTITKTKDGKFYIVDVIENSYADKGGLKIGDEILTINGEVLNKEDDLDKLGELIKEKNYVRLEIMRDNKLKIFDINIGDIVIPVVRSEVFYNDDHNLGYIYISSFTDNSALQFEAALSNLEKEKIQGLIIDLRGNTGGYLMEATNMASHFIIKGKKLLLLEGKKIKEAVLDETEESRQYPIVILVNQYSASASEILALALKESYGAFIVGTNTFGKGKVQQTETLRDDSMIKYTSALWYSPNGNNIDGVGIKPSIYVELSEKYYQELDNEHDNQLITGMNLLYNILSERTQ